MGEKKQQTAQTINQRVVIWAQSHLGKPVGKRRECWDLAEKALNEAGARTSYDFGEVKDDADYIWGEPVDIKDALPGDILQFRDYKVTGTINGDIWFSTGCYQWTEPFEMEASHHTAIVISKLDPNGAIRVLEQNAKPNGKVVQQGKYFTRDIKESVAVKTTVEKRVNPVTKKIEMAKIVTTGLVVTKSGDISAYRPKPK